MKILSSMPIPPGISLFYPRDSSSTERTGSLGKWSPPLQGDKMPAVIVPLTWQAHISDLFRSSLIVDCLFLRELIPATLLTLPRGIQILLDLPSSLYPG